jgi:hypothetical protein
MDELTESEYGICNLAIRKCTSLQGVVGSGKFKLCVVANENVPLAAKNGHVLMVLPFGFPKITDREESVLIEKLDEHQKIAWLKERRK